MLVTPTIRTCLPTLAETDIDHGPPGTEHRFLAVSANTRPFNYLGLPAISVPCGFDPNGCPIGLQIAGRPFAEARMLQVADAYQRDTDWHARRPPVLEAAGVRASEVDQAMRMAVWGTNQDGGTAMRWPREAS